MKRVLAVAGGVICVVALVGWCGDSRAQQSPEDPRVAAYRQLLLRANDELAQALAQANALSAENGQLKAQLPKPKDGAAAPDKKD